MRHGVTEALPSDLLAAIDRAELITFDIFDTALVRSLEQPADLFLLLAYEANIDDPIVFARARLEAEARARKLAWKNWHVKEVTLADIYACLAHSPALASLDLSALMLRERALELRICQRHALTGRVYDFAMSRGRRVGFISDMYLDGPLIADMLKKCKYSEYDFLYVSSELAKTKAHGDLYQHVLAQNDVAPSLQLHIGDNRHSDIRKARQAGISAYHIRKNAESFTSSRVGRRFARRNITAVDLLNIQSGLGVSRELWVSVWRGLVAARGGQAENFWFDLGYSHVGMLLLGFVMWLDRRAAEDGVSNLYFLARDGHVMQRVHRQLAERRLALCSGRYLYASRRTLNIPAITGVDERACDFLVSGTSRLAVTEFLSRTGLTPSECMAEIQAVGLQPDQIVSVGEDYDRLRALFRSLEPALLKLAAAERRLLADYWRQEGLFEQSHIGLVDIGWHGSLQESFARLMQEFGQDTPVTGYYLGTFPPARARTEAGAKHRAYLCEAGDPADRLATIKSSVEIFEWLFCAPHPSVVGFQRSGTGQVRPKFESGEFEQARETTAMQVQAGALKFIEDALNCFAPGLKPPLIPVGLEVALLDDLLKRPTAQEARLLGDLPHAEGFGGVTQVRSIAQPAAKLYHPIAWARLISGYRQAFWRRGYLCRLWSDAW